MIIHNNDIQRFISLYNKLINDNNNTIYLKYNKNINLKLSIKIEQNDYELFTADNYSKIIKCDEIYNKYTSITIHNKIYEIIINNKYTFYIINDLLINDEFNIIFFKSNLIIT